MVRLREIDRETREHERRLEAAWRTVAERCGPDAAAFAHRWRATAELWSFAAVDELIERHNRHYPIEARLPMDVRTRDFVLVSGEPYRRRPLDAAWPLRRFPPRLESARSD